MSGIGNEDAWCESQQTTNGIFRNKIDWMVALDFTELVTLYWLLGTNGNVTARQYVLQVIFKVLNFITSRRYSDDFLAHVKLVLSLVDIGN